MEINEKVERWYNPVKRSEDYWINMLLWGCDPHFDMTSNEFYNLTDEDETNGDS